ncbi:MAG: hypothetical protein GX610_18950, partial [Rhodococcus sp.]|nr:hypothetical protein [Rhodococcus sp. (in: high G+C Gram-positive bacteria)]
MTTPESVSNDLRTLAADERCVHQAADLTLLAEAIASEETEKWVGVDLLSAFPEATTSSERTWVPLEGALGALAAMTVFAPVAWTWFSLNSASQAYLDMTANGARPDDTFLGLWISGFGGHLASWHRLPSVAAVSILLIVLAATLMVAQRAVRGVVEGREEEAAVAFEAHRVSVLSAAQREIGGQHTADPSAIEAIVRSSIKKLSEAHSATKEGVDQLNATSVSLKTVTTTMASAADLTQASLEGIERAASTLETTADKSHRRVTKTLDDFSDRLQDQLTTTQAETGRVVAESSRAMRKVIVDLIAGVDLIEKSQSAIVDSIDTMDRRSAAHSQDLQAVVSQFKSAVE